jgi:hypothetical protein
LVPERCLTLALERLLARHPDGILVNPAERGVRPNGVKSGNESSGQELRGLRPSLAVNFTAHVADSQRFLLQGPLFSKTSARADSQKRRFSVPFRIAGRARKLESCGRGGRQAGAFLLERGFAMRDCIDIDPKHSRAIVQEIGERLRALLKEEPQLPGSLRMQLDRLGELEETSTIPSAERWDKRRR